MGYNIIAFNQFEDETDDEMFPCLAILDKILILKRSNAGWRH